MIENLGIALFSLTLAGLLLAFPVLVRRFTAPVRAWALLALLAAIALSFAWVDSGRQVVAILLLSGVIALLAKALQANYRMVHNAHYPKHRRCY